MILLDMFGLLLQFMSWIALFCIVVVIALRLLIPHVFNQLMLNFIGKREGSKSQNTNRIKSVRKIVQSEKSRREYDETSVVSADIKQLHIQYDAIKKECVDIHSEIKQLHDMIDRLGRIDIVKEIQQSVNAYCASLGQTEHQTKSENVNVLNGSSQKAPLDISFRKLYFAYTPSSVEPYGFTDNDWSTDDKGQPFVLQREGNDEAKFSLSNNTVAHNSILNSLAYYNRLIDYEVTSQEQPICSIKVIEAGLLRKQANVWTIQKKIKIKIN